MDMDLDELEDLGPAPSRSTRFSPKSSKFKPKPKTKPLKPEMDTSFILPSTKEESAEPLITAIDVGNINKVEMESSRMTASTSDIIVKMDTDLKTEGSQLEEDLMEEDNHNDEDPVVREIDVFFTPSMDSNSLLYVIQYPLKPCWRPYELDEHCKEVRVKPVSSEVEIDLSIDLDSKNYDPDSNTGVRVTKQFPLLSRRGVMEKLIAEASGGEDGFVVNLPDIPGGDKTFELVAKFCYGVKLELTAANVVYLRCAAECLEW